MTISIPMWSLLYLSKLGTVVFIFLLTFYFYFLFFIFYFLFFLTRHHVLPIIEKYLGICWLTHNSSVAVAVEVQLEFT
jgi:hypothetical protein